MDINEAAQILRKHNEWRRDQCASIRTTEDPKLIEEAIDVLVAHALSTQPDAGSGAWFLDPDPIESEDGFFTYGVHIGDHLAAIECHGKSKEQALHRAHTVLAARQPISDREWCAHPQTIEAKSQWDAVAHALGADGDCPDAVLAAARSLSAVRSIEGGAIAGWSKIDGVTVFHVASHSKIVEPQQFVRYADYLAAHPPVGVVVGHVCRDSSEARMHVNLPEGSPLYAAPPAPAAAAAVPVDAFAQAVRDARAEVFNNEPHVLATVEWIERRAARYIATHPQPAAAGGDA